LKTNFEKKNGRIELTQMEFLIG